MKEKQPKDLVTDADLASQSAIREILISAFSDYAFVGEEEGEDKPPQAVRDGDIDAPPCWVVDPLDGTVNYVHRLQSFAVSIGLYHGGKARLGVIYDPVGDELFTAVHGQGLIATSKQFQLVNVMILITPSLPAASQLCERWRS